MHEIQDSATVRDEEAHAVMLMPWHRTGGPFTVMAKELANCSADMTPVHTHS